MPDLSFFPTPYPDEDFRSIVYRYHVRTGNTSFRFTNQELFDVNSIKNPVIPRKLLTLLEKLPDEHGLTLNKLLVDHTLWPLVKPFLPESRINALLHKISNGIEFNLAGPTSTSQHRESIFSTQIRYCPKCLNDDFEKYGECYVHRLHQINDVDICHVHHTKLLTQCPICKQSLAHSNYNIMVKTPYCSSGHLISTAKCIEHSILIHKKIKLMNDFETIIKFHQDIDQEELTSRLQLGMVKNGYTDAAGRNRIKKFNNDFKHYMIDEGLGDPNVFSEIIKSRDLTYLRRLISFFPYNIFIMNFLAGGVSEFLFNLSWAIEETLGCGPWPCINKICPSYNEDIIRNYKLEFKYGKVVALFYCATCGCTYYKYKLDWVSYGKKRKAESQIVDKGFLFRNRVVELFNEGFDYIQIAKKLETNQKSVKKILNDKGINLIDYTDDFNSKDKSDLRKKKCRKEILDVIEQNNKLNRTRIRDLKYNCYSWLMKNDEDWMEKVLPKIERNNFINDWQSIDNKLVSVIMNTAQDLYKENPNKRIMKETIINRLPSSTDKHRIKNYPGKLPNSIKVLNECVEPKDDYLIRHIPIVIEQLQRKGLKNITLKSFLRDRPNYKNCSDVVNDEIVNVLKGMGYQNVDTRSNK